jgi:hypothetical protein
VLQVLVDQVLLAHVQQVVAVAVLLSTGRTLVLVVWVVLALPVSTLGKD